MVYSSPKSATFLQEWVAKLSGLHQAVSCTTWAGVMKIQTRSNRNTHNTLKGLENSTDKCGSRKGMETHASTSLAADVLGIAYLRGGSAWARGVDGFGTALGWLLSSGGERVRCKQTCGRQMRDRYKPTYIPAQYCCISLIAALKRHNLS